MRSSIILNSLVAVAVAACGPSQRNDPDGGVGGDCTTEGAHQCSGLSWLTCTGGSWVSTLDCPTACNDTLGCVVCQPGTGTCAGDTSTACNADGTGYYDEFCDPIMGSSCNPTTGTCTGACSIAALGTSYIGCDYYATQTSQLVNPSFQFAVAVSNTSAQEATVTIEGGALPGAVTLMVPANAVATQYLPWVAALKRCMTEGAFECGAPQSYGALAVRGGYHLRSTQPVTVYQFSPLDYAGGGKFSYSNDASLLLPTTSWTGNYVATTWPRWVPSGFPVMPSVLAVTASKDATSVTITTRAATRGGDGAPNFAAGVAQAVTLNAGDVLQLMSDTGDLTGSIVLADKPVQLIGAHHCTQLPVGFPACDHLEESNFPVEALSTKYLVTAPYLPSIAGPRQQVTRITAAEAPATVTLDPPIAGPFTLASRGDFVDVVQRVEDFLVSSNVKVIVSHFMESQQAPPGATTGDPAMTLAVPVEQYRTSYMFHAPTNYDGGNYVNITAPAGGVVMLDGVAVPTASFVAIGASGFGVARVSLSNAGNGTHTADSTVQFGISVYGYGQYTSYWYPGGLDLKPIVIE